MKKFFLIIYGVIVIITIIVSIYLHAKQGKENNNISATQASVPVAEGPLYAYSANGEQGPLIDPGASAVRTDTTTGNMTLQETGQYTLEYFPNGRAFNITLLGKNLRQSRIDAEKELLTRFSLTEEQACSLNVHVGTIMSVSEEFSAQNLGLSFCPNRVDLPTDTTVSGQTPQEPVVIPDIKL